MITEIRKKAPAGWIFLPALSACAISAAAGWAAESWDSAAVVAVAVGLCVAWWAERRLRALVDAMSSIAAGDRYTALPDRTGSGILTDLAATAERMRRSLIDADAIAVDHRSREAETRLHHAGRAFFTGRFRSRDRRAGLGLRQGAARKFASPRPICGGATRTCASAPRPRPTPPRRRPRRRMPSPERRASCSR